MSTQARLSPTNYSFRQVQVWLVALWFVCIDRVLADDRTAREIEARLKLGISFAVFV